MGGDRTTLPHVHQHQTLMTAGLAMLRRRRLPMALNGRADRT